MADGGVIEEFLVSIGFKTDQASFNIAKKALSDLQVIVDKLTASLDKANIALNNLANNQAVIKTVQAVNSGFKEATVNIDDATKSVGNFSNALSKDADKAIRGFQDNMRHVKNEQENSRKGLLEFGTTAKLTMGAFLVQLNDVAKKYADLYYVSQRSHTSVAGIQQLSSATAQLGIDANRAKEIYSALGEASDRTMGASKALFDQIGAPYLQKYKNELKDVDESGQKLAAYVEGLKRNWPLPAALQQMQDTLGVSYEEAKKLIDNIDEWPGKMQKSAEQIKASGVNMKAMAELSKNIEQTWTAIYGAIDLIRTQALQELGPPLLFVLHTVQGILDFVLQINKAFPGAASLEVFTAIALSIGVILRLLKQVAALRFLPTTAQIAAQSAEAGAVAGSAFAGAFASFLKKGAIVVAVADILNYVTDSIENALDEHFGEAYVKKKAEQAIAKDKERSERGILGKIFNAPTDLFDTIKGPSEATIKYMQAHPDMPGAAEYFKRNPQHAPEGYDPAAVERRSNEARGRGAGYTPMGLPPVESKQKWEKEPAATAPIPANALGGLVTKTGVALVEAGEVVLPQSLTQGLLKLTSYRPGENVEGNRTAQKLGDWLTGTSNAPKVMIDNIDEFIRELVRALKAEMGGEGGGEGEGGEGGEAKPGSESPQSVIGRSGEAAGAALGRIGNAMGAAGGAVKAGMEETAKTVGDTVKDVLGGGKGEGGTAVPELSGKGSGTELANQAIAYFMKQGWTKEQAAGIASNLAKESSWNPQAKGDSGKAYGLGQWHPDRQANFKKAFGKDIKDSTFAEQLAFVDWELKNTERAAGERIRKETTARGSGAAASRYYERPGINEEARAREARERGESAETILNQFKEPAAFGMQQQAGSGARAPGGPVNTGGRTQETLQADWAHRTGALGTAQEAAKNLTTVTAPNGAKFQVHADVAPQFQGFLTELSQVYPHIKSGGGYANRNVRGSSSKLSEHAYGAAIDINPNENPMGTKLVTDLPANVGELAAKYGLKWGGTFKGRKDAMHFEAAAKLSPQELASLQNPQNQNPQQVQDRQVAQQQVVQQSRDQQVAQQPGIRQPFEAFPEPPQMARGGLIPDFLLRGFMPAILHAGEMVLPRHLSQGIQGLIGGMNSFMGGRGFGGLFQMLGGMLGGPVGARFGGMAGNVLGGIGGLGGFGPLAGIAGGAMRLGGDISNFARNNSMTLNQTYNNNFNGGPTEMLGAYRQSQDRWTGDLVRNFRIAMI